MKDKPIVKINLFRDIIHIVEEERVYISKMLISGGAEYSRVTSDKCVIQTTQDAGR